MSQLSVDSITGRVAGSAPSFPNGTVVVGVITATTFSGPITGSGSNLTALNASEVTTGTISDDRLPATITKNINSSGSSTLGTLSVTNDATVGGALTVTGNATVSGNLTVNGTTTTIDTVVTSVDRLEVDGGVSVGAALTAVGTVTAAEFIKSDGTAVAGDSDITSCLFV